MSAASQLMDTYGSNIVPSPQPCPPWMCCLLPWLKNTATMQSYRRCVPDSAQITRGGRNLCIDASSVVPGDIVYVETGDTVPADCRVIACSEGLSVCPFDLVSVIKKRFVATECDIRRVLFCMYLELQGRGRFLSLMLRICCMQAPLSFTEPHVHWLCR